MKDKVFWQKPNHGLLNNLGYSQVDMHYHSRYSDGSASIGAIIKRAKKKGIGVAITDHNEVAGAIEAYHNDEGVLVIPGIEVSCIEGPHILLYFYNPKDLLSFFENFLKVKKNGNPYMATNARAREVLKEAEKYKCVKIAAHPYGYMTANRGLIKAVKNGFVEASVLRKLDGVEVLCGAMNRYLNKKSVLYAMKNKMIYTGGSDGHCLFQLGQVVTVCKGKTVKEFLDNLKKRGNNVVGKESKSIPKMLSAGRCVSAHMHYAYPTVKIQTKMFYSRTVHFRRKMAGKILHNGLTKRVSKISLRKL